MDASVPRASTLCIGTITVRPSSWRSLRWEPRWLTSAQPTLPRARATSCPGAEASRSRCERDVHLDRSHYRRLEVRRRRRHVLEVELERPPEGCEAPLLCLNPGWSPRPPGNGQRRGLPPRRWPQSGAMPTARSRADCTIGLRHPALSHREHGRIVSSCRTSGARRPSERRRRPATGVLPRDYQAPKPSSI